MGYGMAMVADLLGHDDDDRNNNDAVEEPCKTSLGLCNQQKLSIVFNRNFFFRKGVLRAQITPGTKLYHLQADIFLLQICSKIN